MIGLPLPRSTASARILFRTATNHGLGSAACLGGTMLSVKQLEDPLVEISASQEQRLIENIVAGLGDHPALGLEAGCSYSLPTFGMFGLACMSATTPREMIEVSLRYQELSSTLARARLVAGRAQTFMELDASNLPEGIRNFVIDHCVAVVWRHTVELDGTPPKATVQLTRERPVDAAMGQLPALMARLREMAPA